MAAESTSADREDASAELSLPEEVAVVNVGLAALGEAVGAQGAAVVNLDWRVPASGDEERVAALTRLHGRHADRIQEANREVLRRLEEGTPVVGRVAPALQVVPGMDEDTVLHSGPALPWDDFCGPLRRSVRATVMAEGWASTREEADERAARGDVRLEPANPHAAVLPMAGSLGPSAPVFVVDNPEGGNRAYTGINQGSGMVPWMGADEPESVERLVWLSEVAGPLLDAVLDPDDPLDVFALVAQGLAMGDDAHMRSQATTNLLLRDWLPRLAGLDDPRRVELAHFLSSNHLFFLNLSMAAAKAVADWAAQVDDSSLVVGMSRNGTTFGIRLAGMPDRWFVTDAPEVGNALYHPDYGPEDGARDIGDSAVLELVGLGGAAAAASPAIASFLGGTMADAVATTEEVQRVSAGRSSRFQLPFLDYRGSPVGVDVRKVVELEVTPSINTGILHAHEPLGQVGAGVAEAPLACFREALVALDDALG